MNGKRLACLSMFLLLAGVLGLQEPAFSQEQQTPPTRVARLSDAQGSVSYQPYGDQNWYQADLDRPITTGDNLWSDQSSRAEFHVGSTAFRMGDQTGVSFLNLNDNAVQVQLAQGSLEINVTRLGPDDAYEIDAPNLAFSILRPGEYRLDADPNGNSTVVTVYSGQGTVTGGGQTFNVVPLQSTQFTGTNQLTENVQRAQGPDDFESWARSREDREEHSMSERYLSPDVAGYENLDDYGSWHDDADYGHYWVPRDVSSDWAPYREGHWVWIAPWGWTWVDSEPWGFTPFHYGRWAMIDGSWGWVPGPVAVAPVYAPALVGFVGGGGFGVAISFGGGVGVGWFPLGPRDVYVPPYQCTPQYVEAINVSNTTVINRTTVVNVYNNYTVNHVTNVNYTYASNPRVVTVVNREAFVSGRPVAQSAMHVNATEIQHPRIVTTAALTPSQSSVIGTARAASAKPPARVASHPLVTKMRPSPRAEPIGRPRPSSNPSLQPAVLKRSGYSPQLQTVRATAASRAPARGVAPAPSNRAPSPARPNAAQPEPRPNNARPTPPPNQPNRPFTPPNRTAPNPNRAQPNNARPTPNRPNRTFTPPNRPANAPDRPQENNATPTAPPNRPNRTFTPPNRPEAAPNRRSPSTTQPNPNRPTPQPRPEARPPAARPVPRPEPRREAVPPPRPMPKPNAAQPRPTARPTPPPRPRPPVKRPPQKKPNKPHKPGEPGQPGDQPLA